MSLLKTPSKKIVACVGSIVLVAALALPIPAFAAGWGSGCNRVAACASGEGAGCMFGEGTACASDNGTGCQNYSNCEWRRGMACVLQSALEQARFAGGKLMASFEGFADANGDGVCDNRGAQACADDACENYQDANNNGTCDNFESRRSDSVCPAQGGSSEGGSAGAGKHCGKGAQAGNRACGNGAGKRACVAAN